MRLLRCVISSAAPVRASSITWQFAQVFWVGGIWVLHFVLLKALVHLGFASVLVHEVEQYTRSIMVGFALACVMLQLIVLIRVLPAKQLLNDIRGQLLLAALLLSSSFLLIQAVAPNAQYWLVYSYIVLGLCGLLLVIQPVPMQHPTTGVK
mgnify:FL=1